MFHTLIIVGNLGRDPEMRYTNTGQAVTSFSLATSRKYTDSGGQQQKETIWFNITVWGKQAESCNNFLHKGSSVVIEGQLKPDPITGGPRIFPKSDGTSGAKFEVTARTVRFLSTRGGAGEPSAEAGIAEEPTDSSTGEDIPF